MKSHTLFVISLLPFLNSGCGAADPSALPAPSESVASPLRLELDTDALGVGKSSTVTISLSKPAPDDGAAVALSSTDGLSLAMPSTITIPVGETTATFTITNSYGGPRKSVTITAKYEDASAEASLFVPSLPPEPPACKGHACLM